MIGKRDVTATLLSGDRERSTPEHDSFQQLPSIPASGSSTSAHYALKSPPDHYGVSYKPGKIFYYIIYKVSVKCNHQTSHNAYLNQNKLNHSYEFRPYLAMFVCIL